MSHNARCPVCNEAVFFYANSHGSRVFFDFPGPDWPKHPCTDRAKISSDFLYQVSRDDITARYAAKKVSLKILDRNGWKLFKVIRSKSFRLEMEHIATGKRYETSLIKDKLPTLSSAIWLRLADHGVELSFFNMEKFRVVVHHLTEFEARKFGTMNEWKYFTEWFSII